MKQHKGEGRCGISQGVGAVYNNKTVEIILMVDDGFGQSAEVMDIYIRAVDRKGPNDVDVCNFF